MTSRRGRLGKWAGGIVAGLTLLSSFPSTASAQPDDPNPGAITLTGGFDVPSLYYFRGIRQETDPKPVGTYWPFADVGIALMSGDGAIKTVGLNVGVWNSLHLGSSGGDGPTEHLHYEEDFYTTLNLGFGGGVGLGISYMALTSPNNLFNTTHEFQVKVSSFVPGAGKWAPYAFLAMELSEDGSADLIGAPGNKKGTYLELGAGPSWALGSSKATFTVPLKVGLSLKDYYEIAVGGDDNKFGFFDIGGLVTIPLPVAGKFGSWNVHAGGDYLRLGETTGNLNIDTDGNISKNAGTFVFGIGLSY
jgi:hypothetical protein